jgi:hypothetical protein
MGHAGDRCPQESSWREDNYRVSNGDQVSCVTALAMKRGKSVDFTAAASAGRSIAIKSRANPKADAAMAVLLLGGPTPNGYAARRTSFNATLSFAFRFLTR